MNDFTATIIWGLRNLINSSLFLAIFIIAFIEFLMEMPMSLSSVSIALMLEVDILIVIYVVSGRLTALFERRQIEPLLSYPGKTWTLYLSTLIPYLIITVILGLSLIFTNPTLFSVRLSILIATYVLIFFFIVSSLSILIRNSTINVMFLSFLYLIPPIYSLFSTSATKSINGTYLAIESISPFSALLLFQTNYSSTISVDSVIFLSIASLLFLFSLVYLRFADVL